jgi:hypothetical protein
MDWASRMTPRDQPHLLPFNRWLPVTDRRSFADAVGVGVRRGPGLRDIAIYLLVCALSDLGCFAVCARDHLLPLRLEARRVAIDFLRTHQALADALLPTFDDTGEGTKEQPPEHSREHDKVQTVPNKWRPIQVQTRKDLSHNDLLSSGVLLSGRMANGDREKH